MNTPRRTDAEQQRDQIMSLALGRIFRLGSRPTQPGDIEQYEAARRVFWAAYDDDPFPVSPDHTPNHARQRGEGAQGQ